MPKAAGQDAPKNHTGLWLGVLLALLGGALSLYATLHHLEVHAVGRTTAGCNINASFSCDAVALSPYSELAGVPLGVFGLGYFAAILVVLGSALAGFKSATDHLHGYAALVVIGLLCSIGLGSIAAGLLGTYCIVCMGVYLVTLLQGVLLAVMRRRLLPPGLSAKTVLNGLTTAGVTVAVVVVGFNLLKPSHQPEHLDLPQTSPVYARTKNVPKTQEITFSKSPYSGLGEDYRKGGDQAKVVVMEFADFQCPACSYLSKSVRQLHQEYGDKVLFVFRNYPLDSSCNSSLSGKMHEYSCKAAILARCAGSYGKFWEYHNQLFDHQEAINTAKLTEWALALGLTSDQIESCLASKDILAKVQDDIAIGNRMGLTSTPTVLINGRPAVGGTGLDDLRNQINMFLN